MNRAQTDNSYFEIKVKLRLEHLPKKKAFRVLDCFHGDGLIWQKIQQLRPDRDIKVLGIDKKKTTKSLCLVGENMKFLRTLNLAEFDAVDLDAYGVPYQQLNYVLTAEQAPKALVIYGTFIQSLYGGLPAALLADLGYTQAMIRKIPTLFYRHGFEKLKQYLAQNGITRMSNYTDHTGLKHYFAIRKTKRVHKVS